MNLTDQLIAAAEAWIIPGTSRDSRYGRTIIRRLLARVRELEAERAGLRRACEKFLWHFEDLDESIDPKEADDAKLVIGLMRAALAGPIPTPTETTR